MSAHLRVWRFALLGALCVGLSCATFVWLVSQEQSRLLESEQFEQLRSELQMIAPVLGEQFPDLDAPPANRLIAAVAMGYSDIVIATLDGRLLMDTRRNPTDAGTAPGDLRAVIADGVRVERRRWSSVADDHLVAAMRINRESGVVGVIWIARPAPNVWDDARAAGRLSIMTIVVAVLSATMYLLLTALIRRHFLQRVIETARRISEQDLSYESDPATDRELGTLASTLQTLRTRLAKQVGLIERQKRMLESLVNQLREGVIVARGDGRIALLNPTAVRLLNLSPPTGGEDGFVGRPVESCIPQHAIQRLLCGPLRPPDASTPYDGVPQISEETRTSRLEVQTRRGTIHLLARVSEVVLADPQHTASDGSVGRVIVLTDITELHRTDQVRTDFVANASHELRTPLSTIRAAVETLLAMDLKTEAPAAQQFLAKIDRHSLRMQQMVADLLDLSKLESPTERFLPEVIECRRLLQDTHARFADALERKDLRWEARVEPPDAVTLSANPQLVRLILDNLIDNAIKFTEPGGSVRLFIRHQRDAVTLEVEDTGCGIPPEDQQRVFERFYQVQRSRSGPERGTGLGLSIVRHAAGAMGGSVELSSHLGQGTKIGVRIPRSE